MFSRCGIHLMILCDSESESELGTKDCLNNCENLCHFQENLIFK